MTLRQQWIIVLVVVTFFAVTLGVGAYSMRDELFPVEVGSRAPAFRARTVDGSNAVRTLDSYKGKVVVLNIWATWCPPCIVEMPSFERLRSLVPDTNLKIEILWYTTSAIDRAYQVTGYPETFVIARDGTIRKKWIGPADWSSPANVALVRGLLGS
jgi:cytochrome c biogenesis protein CcmG/thiol:disulfide interchange protein DsbE